MKDTPAPRRSYYAPQGGLPAQTDLHTGRAVFTEAYAVIPRGVLLGHRDQLPARLGRHPPLDHRPPDDRLLRDLLPVRHGGLPRRRQQRPRAGSGSRGRPLRRRGRGHPLPRRPDPRPHPRQLRLPAAGPPLEAPQRGRRPGPFHWVRKRYQPAEGIPAPDPLVLNERDIAPTQMPDTEGRWATTRFVDPNDLRHDMHVTIVTFEPGGQIPFEETHVMEHGLYVLEGKAVYRLNRDWVEVEAGDFMWLRAFCPQACYAGGPGRFRYLLYKDVNRHARLGL